MNPIRIATRNSPLALWQAEFVAARLAEWNVPTELVPLVSSGDTDLRPIDGTRQVGVFTKRIQQALLDHEADVAVHSLKDLPTEKNEQLSLAAVPQRETVADSLVSKNGWQFSELPQGAVVGTGSRRRAAQVLNRRPDLRVQPIRGNVQTRLAKLDSNDFDAIVLAEAGLIRLGLTQVSRTPLERSEMLPAPGQGALGIEVRSDDPDSFAAIARLDDPDTRAAVTAERTLLAALHGGCLAPIAALGEVEPGRLRLTAVVLSPDGSKRLDEQDHIEIAQQDPQQLAIELAERLSRRLIDRGASALINSDRQK